MAYRKSLFLNNLFRLQWRTSERHKYHTIPPLVALNLHALQNLACSSRSIYRRVEIVICKLHLFSLHIHLRQSRHSDQLRVSNETRSWWQGKKQGFRLIRQIQSFLSRISTQSTVTRGNELTLGFHAANQLMCQSTSGLTSSGPQQVGDRTNLRDSLLRYLLPFLLADPS